MLRMPGGDGVKKTDFDVAPQRSIVKNQTPIPTNNEVKFAVWLPCVSWCLVCFRLFFFVLQKKALSLHSIQNKGPHLVSRHVFQEHQNCTFESYKVGPDPIAISRVF